MRDIKFRAWHVEGKCFVRDFILDDRGNYYISDHCEYMGDDRELILMQYTGLKDKNGKEIYEGDIVKTSIGIQVVKDLFCNFVIYTYEDIDRMNSPEKHLEIIVNIYEHKHLLENK